MTISFNPASQSSSTEYLLPHEPHLSPPVSDHSLSDVPFTPKDGDQISLGMKKRKNRRHGISQRLFSRNFHGSEQDVEEVPQKRRKKPKRSFRRATLQRSVSLPLLQPRFTHGDTQLLYNVEPQHRPRTWTIPSKAASTRGLTPILPLNHRQEEDDASDPSLLQSPAMITLRRATTSHSARRMTLTTFPTPQFGRVGSGFLSSVLSSFTSTEAGTPGSKPNLDTASGEPLRLPSASISSTEAMPSVSTTAPVVCTELVMIELQSPNSARGQSINPLRRCSTRIVSDDNVYEILWDEESSSNSSRGLTMPRLGSDSSVASRRSSAVDVLQSQLSRASTRRSSLQVSMARHEADPHDHKNVTPNRSHGGLDSPFARFPGGKLTYDFPPSQTRQAGRGESCLNPSQCDDVLPEPQSDYNDDQDGLSSPLGGGITMDKNLSCPETPAETGDRHSNSMAGNSLTSMRKHCARSMDERTHAKVALQQNTSSPHQKAMATSSATAVPRRRMARECEGRGKAPRLCTLAAAST